MRTIHRPTWKDVIGGLKILGWAIGIFCAWLLLLWATSADAQTVVRKGNSFYQQSNSNKIEKDSAVFSGYYYFDTKGIKYPIYISSKGKCFIWRTSSKTSKPYKHYLPEVTKQLEGSRYYPKLVRSCGSQVKL